MTEINGKAVDPKPCKTLCGFGLDDEQVEFCRNAKNLYQTATMMVRWAEDANGDADGTPAGNRAILKAGSFMACYVAQFEYAGRLLARRERRTVRPFEVVDAIGNAIEWMLRNGIAWRPEREDGTPLLPSAFSATHDRIVGYRKAYHAAIAAMKAKSTDRI